MLCLRSIRVLGCLLGFCFALPAQQYVFRAYRQAEGLKNLSVNGLARDRDGFLWAATENGVYRFLGSRFEQFGREQGITELDVREIVADPTGTVWAGTAENLYRWDGQRFVPAGRQPIHLLGSHRIAVEDGRHLLVVDEHQLYRLEHDAQGRMISYLPVFSGRLRTQIQDLEQVSSVRPTARRCGDSIGQRQRTSRGSLGRGNAGSRGHALGWGAESCVRPADEGIALCRPQHSRL